MSDISMDTSDVDPVDPVKELMDAKATITELTAALETVTADKELLEQRLQALEQAVRVEPEPLFLAIVDEATGDVIGDWSGGGDRPPALPAGRIAIDKADHPGIDNFSKKKWNGSTFEEKA